MLFKGGEGTEGKNYSEDSKDLFGPLETSKKKNSPYMFVFLMLFSNLFFFPKQLLSLLYTDFASDFSISCLKYLSEEDFRDSPAP